MKIQKSKTLLLSLLITLSLNVAHAQSLSDVLGGIKNKINEAQKAAKDKMAAVSEDKVVNNSLLELTGVVDSEVKWLMVVIKKNNFKEQLTLAVNNGLYQTRVSLQDVTQATSILKSLRLKILTQEI